MKMKYGYVLIMVLACFRTFGQDDMQNSLTDKVNSIMEPLANSNNYGGSVLIVKDGKEWFSKSYGNQDEENNIANSEETKYMLASASMIFTSAAIMKLVDDGKLSLSDKISDFFPEFRNGDQITIHHMLAQRSGIPAWDSGIRLANFNRKQPHTTERLMSYFDNDDLIFEPGSKYAHGRSEYIVLAAIVEKVTDQTFEAYLAQSIFKPLGMNNSGHYAHTMTDEDIPGLAKGYTEKGFTDVTVAPGIHWSVKTGHASVYSTVGDLKKFAEAVLENKLLSESSWEAILTDYGSSVGYGWFLNPQGDHKRYQMNGRSPGFSTYFGIYPDENLVVIMLSNRYVSLPFFVGPELASAALGDAYEVLKLSIQDVDPKLANRITGRYKMGSDFYRPNGVVTIKYRNGKMYSGSYPLIPVLGEDGKITAFIHRHYWSRLTFSEDENGQIKLQFDDYSGQKQGLIEQWKWWFLGLGLLSTLLYLITKKRSNRKRLRPQRNEVNNLALVIKPML